MIKTFFQANQYCLKPGLHTRDFTRFRPLLSNPIVGHILTELSVISGNLQPFSSVIDENIVSCMFHADRPTMCYNSVVSGGTSATHRREPVSMSQVSVPGACPQRARARVVHAGDVQVRLLHKVPQRVPRSARLQPGDARSTAAENGQ